MTDFSKISKAVRAAIERIGGENKKIDTKKEVMELGQWLNGNRNSMGRAEVEFVEGFIIERSFDVAKKEHEENGTKAAAKEIARILKSPGPNKKTLDSPVEAQALATLLAFPPADFNQTDLEYIKFLLGYNGFGYMVPQQSYGEVAPVESAASAQQAQSEIPSTESKNAAPDVQSKKSILPPAPNIAPEPIQDTPPENVPDVPSTEPQPTNPGPTAPIEQPEPTLPEEQPVPAAPAEPGSPKTLSEAGRAEGAALASQLLTAFDNTITDNKDVRDILSKVNPENAYTFLTGITKGLDKGLNVSVLKNISDVLDRLSYKDTLHVMQSLEQQANNLGLKDTPAIQALAQENKRIAAIVKENPKEDPSMATAKYSDSIIQAALDEISKAVDGKVPERKEETPAENHGGADIGEIATNMALSPFGLGGAGLRKIINSDE